MKSRQRARTRQHQVHVPASSRASVEDEIPQPQTPVRWAAEDPDATWWDDVWPFRDETVARSPEREEPEQPEQDEPEPVTEPGFGADDEVPEPARDPALDLAVWTVPAVPEVEVERDRRERLRRMLAAAAMLAVVVIVAVVAWVETRPGSTPVAAQLTHADRYAAPTPLQPDTSYVRTRIRPSGVLDVTHWIRTARPVDAIHLRTPVVTGLSPGDVYVLHVVLVGDGVPVPVTETVDAQGVTTIRIPPSQQVFLRYHLAGVLQYAGSTDASQGAGDRGLARITSLEVSTSRPLLRATHTVTGADVLALACGAPGQAVAVPCGTERRGTWSASLGPDEQSDRVLAQVDLTR